MRCLCLFGLLLVACGGDKSPVEKCDDLINVVCDRGVQCVGSTVGTHAQCVQQIQQSLSCGAAKSVSATYDRCIDQLNADSCQVLFPPDPDTGEPTLMLPADCMSVILTREAPPAAQNPTWKQMSWAADSD